MPRIEDYALIGDMQTAALVSRDGSIDWLCLPKFDSGACFAALLGTPEHGCWKIAPKVEYRTRRRYRDASLVLETEFSCDGGTVRVVDCMPPRGAGTANVVRIVEGVSGEVPMHITLVIRFDYGSIVPWVRRIDGALSAVAGPDALFLWTPVEVHGEGLTTQADFTVRAGERIPFVLAWNPSHLSTPRPIDGLCAVEQCEAWWREWAGRCTYRGRYREQVLRSAITLKALTYEPTGGIVAAPTTSLPEQPGGVRNWDYRYCWLRDATFTLYALMNCGYVEEAEAWRNWLLRAVAGDPSKLQIMYGTSGERRILEHELPWLPGFENSRPVRVGNAASVQFQLDVYGEVMDALHLTRRAGIAPDQNAWNLQRELMRWLEHGWTQPDEGIWEVRGPRRHFTHSKVMAWVAFDRAVKAVERFGYEGPVEHWRTLREWIRAEVFERGYDPRRNTFTQFYGSRELDASLLMLPLVGFIAPDDARMRGTVAAIERELLYDGFVLRYLTSQRGEIDGLPGGEGVFLACSFWLVDNYLLQGRREEARALYERLLSLANDVGLLSEEYDPAAGRLLGNFPQALSHLALINSACNFERGGPAEHREHA